MEKVKRFFRNLSEKRSYQIVFFVVSMCVVLGGYVVLRMRIAEEVSHRYTVVEDKNLVKFVEEAIVENDVLTISGWCFYKGIDSSKDNVQVFLRNINDEEDLIWLEVENIQREDVNEYYGGNVDYRETGFKASAKVSEVDLETNNYEVMIKFSNDSKKKNSVSSDQKKVVTVETKKYICKGVLCDFPYGKENIFSKFGIPEMRDVFEKGTLHAWREEEDVYIFQLDNKLFWVIGDNYLFEDSTYMQYQLDTTRSDLLPTERQKNNWDFDNIGFLFEWKEIELSSDCAYRVAVCEIPSEYPVTGVETGYYIDSVWRWREYFNIDIRYLQK